MCWLNGCRGQQRTSQSEGPKELRPNRKQEKHEKEAEDGPQGSERRAEVTEALRGVEVKKERGKRGAV